MRVHLKGKNGRLDRMENGIATILWDGDKIHCTYDAAEHGIVRGFSVKREDYYVLAVADDTAIDKVKEG